MKHLKTFESFNEQQLEEGFFSNLMKPELNLTHKKIITKALKELDTEKVKFMSSTNEKKYPKVDLNIDGFLKMAEEIDNYNGRLEVKGDTAVYIPASFKGKDGGFKTKGGFGG